MLDKYSNNDEETVKEKEKEKNTPQKVTITKDKNSGTLKGKRKDLSMSMRQMIESEQSNVVKLYKELKKNQRAQNKT